VSSAQKEPVRLIEALAHGSWRPLMAQVGYLGRAGQFRAVPLYPAIADMSWARLRRNNQSTPIQMARRARSIFFPKIRTPARKVLPSQYPDNTRLSMRQNLALPHQPAGARRAFSALPGHVLMPFHSQRRLVREYMNSQRS